MGMQWAVIIVLAILVVIGAYALGTYLRRRQEDDAPMPAPQLPRRASSTPAAVPDREVRVVVNWLLSQAFEQTGIRVADDKLAYERIVEAAHKAVKSLKTQPAVDVSLPFLTADASGPKHLEARLTREMINELVKY
jgi:hypothetical protein